MIEQKVRNKINSILSRNIEVKFGTKLYVFEFHSLDILVIPTTKIVLFFNKPSNLSKEIIQVLMAVVKRRYKYILKVYFNIDVETNIVIG